MPGCALSLSTFSLMPYPEMTVLAREAEDAGFSGLFVPEANNDGMMCCYLIAQATKRITVGTRIINIYQRAATVCATGAMMIQEQSGGRFLLGLGVGHRLLLKPLGIEMGNARDYLRQYMGLLTAVLNGQQIPNLGYRFRVSPKRVPVYFAALTLQSARFAGEVADGVMLYMCPPERMSRMKNAAREAAIKAGRDPMDLGVTMGLPVFLDDNLEAAYAAARRDMAFYLGLHFYNRIWAQGGFEAQAKQALAAAERGDRAGVSAAMTDAMIDAVALAGPASRCLERLAQYRSAGADLPVLVSHAVSGDYASAFRNSVKIFGKAN
ncbi:MAG: LLM class flavin-dependent oxidoreductase [Candidatus Binataceae bacterium]|nr:LLM class flavin-dependent oxidoreductase [Candidatus Binataceae bacterium]